MKSGRNQLILLGLICQGYSWNDWVIPSVYTMLWLVTAYVGDRGLWRPATFWEGIVLAGGSLLAYFGLRLEGQTTHFFIGHGLALLQLLRMMRPLVPRENSFSFLIASFHIAVGCTVVLDFRFILIALAAVFLVPRALMEMAQDYFPSGPRPRIFRPRWSSLALIFSVSLFFFLLFPRGFIAAPFRTTALRAGQGGFLDSMLDMAGGGSSQSSRVLFQVQGDRVGYLRHYALTEYSQGVWKPSRVDWNLTDLRELDERASVGLLHRRARVKYATSLGKVLPTDGFVVGVGGKFFRNAVRDSDAIVKCGVVWNTVNNVYDYWTDPAPKPEYLWPARKQFLTRAPDSPRLRSWLNKQLAGVLEPREQAHRLETLLQETFEYELGAPELSRQSPVEDFIFNQRRGHCERFASALAVLLRMQGIPSRVIVGYLPSSKSWISGWYNIRFRDAHAWTEAWFPESGWITLDATPRARGVGATSSTWRDLIETLDFIWYSQIVNFDAPAQQKLLVAALLPLKSAAEYLWENVHFFVETCLIVLLLILWRRLRAQKRSGVPAARRLRNAQILAEHYYGRMLKLLASAGEERAPQLTPFEFLQEMERRNLECIGEIRQITEFFCATRYGGRLPRSDEEAAVHSGLRSIANSLKGQKRRSE